jgi:hypothetical protein
VTERLTDLLGQDRTWTSRQLAEALRTNGITIGRRRVRRYLAHLKARYRRAAKTVSHKQDAAKVARAAAVLGGLKKKSSHSEGRWRRSAWSRSGPRAWASCRREVGTNAAGDVNGEAPSK